MTSEPIHSALPAASTPLPRYSPLLALFHNPGEVNQTDSSWWSRDKGLIRPRQYPYRQVAPEYVPSPPRQRFPRPPHLDRYKDRE
ncbi:hypothetical protein OPQ81_009073 [Rhizoctonia solani]|nr:hypothetical protein OPQ81_009073 [Rhizoctonia solani]